MYLVIHSYRCHVRWIEEYASPKIMSIFSNYYMSSQLLSSDYAIGYLFVIVTFTEFTHTHFYYNIRPMSSKSISIILYFILYYKPKLYPLLRCLTKSKSRKVSFRGLICLNPNSSFSASSSMQMLMDGNLTYSDCTSVIASPNFPFPHRLNDFMTSLAKIKTRAKKMA